MHALGCWKQLCIGWAERGGPEEEKVGGNLSSPLLDLNARNIFLNSANMKRCQNTKQARGTIIESGRGGEAEGRKGQGIQGLSFGKNFEN